MVIKLPYVNYLSESRNTCLTRTIDLKHTFDITTYRLGLFKLSDQDNIEVYNIVVVCSSTKVNKFEVTQITVLSGSTLRFTG